MYYLGLKGDPNDLITVSDNDGTLSVGTNVLPPGVYFDTAQEIEKIIAYVEDAPTGEDLILSVLENGIAIDTLTIAAGTTKAETVLTHTIAADALVTVDIIQVGSTTPGKNLSVSIVVPVATSGGDHVDTDHADAFAALSHDHNATYYTEAEIDTALAGKANTHTHPYASDTHDHNDIYYTETEVNTALAAKADTHTHPYASDTHNHDAAYATAAHAHTTANLLAIPGATVKLVYISANTRWELPNGTVPTLTGRVASILWEGTAAQIPAQGPGDAEFQDGDTAFIRATSL